MPRGWPGASAGASCSHFPDEEVAELAATIGVRRVEPGTRLVREREPVDFIRLSEAGEWSSFGGSASGVSCCRSCGRATCSATSPYLCRMASPFTARALSDVVLIALDVAVLARLLGSRLACASGSSSA